MQFPLSPLWAIASHLFSFWELQSPLWLHRMWIFSVSSFSILQDSVSENRHSSVFLLLVYHFLFPLCPHHNFIFYCCFGLMKMQFYNINLWKAEIVKTIKRTGKIFCQIFWWKQRVLLLYSGSQHTWIISSQENVSQFLSRLLRWIQFIAEHIPMTSVGLWGFSSHASEIRLWIILGGTIKVLPKKEYTYLPETGLIDK